MSDDQEHLTLAIIAYRKNRLNNRLLFGAPVTRIRRGWRREFAAFRPGQIFGYERWRGDKYGTQDWRIFICKAAICGPVTALPGIEPGAVLLAYAIGKTKAKRVLALLDQLKKETDQDLTKTSEARWRVFGNAIEIGTDPTNKGRKYVEH